MRTWGLAVAIAALSSFAYGEYRYVAEFSSVDRVTIRNPRAESAAFSASLVRRHGAEEPLTVHSTLGPRGEVDVRSLFQSQSNGFDAIVIEADAPLFVFVPAAWSPIPNAHPFHSALQAQIGDALDPIPLEQTVLAIANLGQVQQRFNLTWYGREGRELRHGIVTVPAYGYFKSDVRLTEQIDGFVIVRAESSGEFLVQGLTAGTFPKHVAATALRVNGLRPATDATRRRVANPINPPTPPTSEELIDEALARGQINEETALVYKVFSDFEDPRLPLQYRGQDREDADSANLVDVMAKFGTLSAPAKEMVRPFLIAPIHAGSWYEMRGPNGLHGPSGQPPLNCGSSPYPWIPLANPLDPKDVRLVRFWYFEERGKAKAEELRSALPRVWDALTGLMERSPLPDGGSTKPEGVCRGGDDRLDIMVIDAPTHYTSPFPDGRLKETPAFVVLRRDATGATLAHELMHVLQFTYDVEADSIMHPDYKWWREATATWAQDFVYGSESPLGTSEHTWASDYLNKPHLSLTETGSYREYGAYLWPFYLVRSQGDPKIVKRIWDKCEDENAVEANEAILEPLGGFEAIWPAFASRNWNRLPDDEYRQWDGLTSGAAPKDTFDVAVTPDQHQQMPLELPPLSATYYYFYIPPEARSVAFFNGLTFKLSKTQQTFFGVDHGLQYEVTNVSEDAKKGAGVWARRKRGGSWLPFEVWTNSKIIKYCLQNPQERFEELLLIFSNSDTDDDRKLVPSGLPPTLVVTNMACSWEGTLTYSAGRNLELAMGPVRITYNLTRTPLPVLHDEPSIPGFAFTPGGTATWTANGTAGGCTYQGQGSVGLRPYAQLSFNFAPRESSTYRKVYIPQQTETGFSYMRSCPNVPAHSVANNGFGLTFPPLDPFKKHSVDASGAVIAGTEELLDGEIWEWRLTAKP